MCSTPGKIYLIPTPIGNISDITRRGIEILEEADIVACEDTRVSGRLLSRFNIRKKLVSYHNFNEQSRAENLIKEVLSGKIVAVISDAGSPGISDPAFRIVRAAIENDIPLEALPGPTALIPALTISGLPTDRFTFEGFLPRTSGARTKRLEEISKYPHTIIFYESPHRIVKLLAAILETIGDRNASLAREISKKFEEIIRGTVSELLAVAESRRLKGEIVLVLAGLDKKARKNKNDE